MGKKSREKRDRAGGRTDRAQPDTTRKRRIALILTAVLALAVVATVVTISLLNQPASAEEPAPTADSRAALDRAAAAIRFRPEVTAGVGLVEALPADTRLCPDSPTLLPVGAVAPEFSLKGPTGETVRLSDYRGKAVLLEFFATWCPHCQAEAPHLVRIHANLDPERFAIISINGNSEDAASVHAYDRYYGIPFPTLLDPGGTPGSYYQAGGAGVVSRAYRIAEFPTFYVIDPDGRITWSGDSEQPNAKLIQELERAAAR